jgi:hypothetical protein
MNNEEVLNNLSNIVVALAAIATVWLASRGLKTWQDELRGKAGYDAAYRYLVAALKLRREIQNIRNSFQSFREDDAAYLRERGIDPDDHLSHNPAKRARGERAWYDHRWQPVVDAMQELEAVALDAEAVLGEEAVQELVEMRKILVELWAAIKKHLNSISETDPNKRRDLALEAIGIVHSDGNDAFSNRLNDTIRQIRARLRPHLG